MGSTFVLTMGTVNEDALRWIQMPDAHRKAGRHSFVILSPRWSQRVMNNMYLYNSLVLSRHNTVYNYLAVITQELWHEGSKY